MRLTVVIPVFNEVATLEELLAKVEAVDIDKEVIIVDDFSTDGTRDLLTSSVSPTASLSYTHPTPEKAQPSAPDFIVPRAIT